RVQAGQVIVEALGTVFTVDRTGTGVRVNVGRGRVRVGYGTGSSELAVGQSGTFPPPAVPATDSAATNPSVAPSSSASEVAAPAPAASPTGGAFGGEGPGWRELARAGKSSEAYRALESAPASDLN